MTGLSVRFQVEDIKGELLERYKVLPALSSRLSELENQSDELREKNRQVEQKLATMQVKLLPRQWGGSKYQKISRKYFPTQVLKT